MGGQASTKRSDSGHLCGVCPGTGAAVSEGADKTAHSGGGAAEDANISEGQMNHLLLGINHPYSQHYTCYKELSLISWSEAATSSGYW